MDADYPLLTPLTAIVLAAGAGTRMRSTLPKVLQPIAGRPMLLHVLAALREAGLTDIVVVTGHQAEQIESTVEAGLDAAARPRFVRQAEQLGTGHAVLQARAAVQSPEVLVVYGDHALLQPEHVRAVAKVPAARMAVASAEVPDPTGLGRILRNEDGSLAAIVEEADTSPAQAAIREVNLGLYRFDSDWLWDALAALSPSASGEIYLGDVLDRTTSAPGSVQLVSVDVGGGWFAVDTRAQLAHAERVLRARTLDRLMECGVSVIDPATTYVDCDIRIGPDTTLEPGTHLRGATSVGSGCVIGPNAVIRDSHIGDDCTLSSCTVEGTMMAARVHVGPYSTLRTGTVIAGDVHIGTHAEIKNSRLGRGVRMGHFAYLGDAEVGAETNIGAGAITCNFDGQTKHRTRIGERVFIGSDSLLIAPLEIGDGAATGAGAVVNRSVAAGERVVGHPARRSSAAKRGSA